MIYLLLSPLTWALGGFLVLACAPSARRVRRVSGCVAVLAVIAMTPFGANLLLKPLETWARAESLRCDGAAAPVPRPTIVLAGGFQRSAHDANDIAALTYSSFARSAHAAGLYRAGKVSHLYVSGGPTNGGVSEGAVMSTLLLQLGLKSESMTTEQQARDTWANAAELRSLLRPEHQTATMRLVTSALHMRRAAIAFEAAGIAVCPAPTEWQHIPFNWGLGYFLPQRSSLDKSERVLHEWVGLLAYRWRAH